MILLIFVLIAIIAFLYLYLTWNFNYWHDLNVAAPKDTRILFGDLPNGLLRKKHAFYDLDKIYNEFKGKSPFVGIIQTRSPRLMILEPDLVKDVLIRKFNTFRNSEFTDMIDHEKDVLFSKNPFFLKDDQWKEKRADITPAFTNNRLKALYPLAQDVLDRLVKYVQSQTQALDVKELSTKYTVDVVSNSIYGIDAGSFKTEKPEIREMGRKLLAPANSVFLKMFLKTSFPFLERFISIQFTTVETQAFFTNLMEQALEYREKNNVHREDFLDYVIQLRKKKHISDIEMASHTISFFTDGSETSSIAISNAIYELAKNKRVQDKLREEVNKHFDKNGQISYDDLSEISYLEHVFYESLRLHPPAVATTRKCDEDVELKFDGKSVQIKKGMNVDIPIQCIHYDPEIYLEPNSFSPERFDDGGLKSYRDRCVLLPFGDGPRICLGMRFAFMQSKLALAGLVHNFEMTVNEKTQDNPLIIDPSEFLNIKKGGLWIDFKPISSA